ncbi:MAG: hypothetical protein EAZ07_01010 [Cytophagales bacterium]|nr:MAG: hypothetical protein EAZ07_01010 [Cytophagales bacterium]
MKYLILFTCLISFSTKIFAQDDLLQSLDSISPKKKDFVIATFKSTRVVNAHSIDVVGRRALDFRIAHRFGPFNSGFYNWYGLDGPATIKISLEYSFDGRLMFGIGRSSLQKMYEGFLKYRLLRQTTDGKMPLSITLLSSMNMNMQKKETVTNYIDFNSRFSYAHQAIIGRKFNEKLSLQVSPTLIHYNTIGISEQQNTMFMVVGAGRFKFTRSVALTFEYGLRFKNMTNNYEKYYNSFSLGIDIETGGHVFQMFVSNSIGMNEVQFLPYTSSSWKDGGIRLGFNVSRIFGI